MKLRLLKRDISYLTEEVISNCYVARYFQGESAGESLDKSVEKAIELHNSLIERANHPADKQNRKLVRRHYSALRAEMFSGIDNLFAEVSTICSK